MVASLCTSKNTGGFTLTEMIVTLTIISILASVAVPYAEVGYHRAREIELRQALRTIRKAIDRFYHDCQEGTIAKNQEGVSENCYPETLQVLVEGVDTGDAEGRMQYYLRRIPRDPFAESDLDIEKHWETRGYRDAPDGAWSGDDVFDVRVTHHKRAIDGSEYREW